MLRAVIIADDMTGALDSGVKLAEKGFMTVATIDQSCDFSKVSCDALIVNTESRHISVEEAYNRVFYAAKKAEKAGAGLIYKKVDSTLRGNIGAELQAVMDAAEEKNTGKQSLVFAPSLPQSGRTLVSGVLFVDDIPLNQTAFARDPLNPISTGDVADIIAMQTATPVKNVFVDEKIHEEQAGLILCDAASDDDLFAIAKKVKSQGRRILAGSAGLAEYIPFILGRQNVFQAAGGFSGPMLFIVGSVNDAAIAQTDFAAKNGINTHTLTVNEIFTGKLSGFIIEEAVKSLQKNESYLIRCVASANGLRRCAAAAKLNGITMNEMAENAGKAAAFGAREILKQAANAVPAVFGGDTLLKVMKGLDVKELMPVKELLPGTVLSMMPGGKAIISKAGGFGGEDVILRLIDMGK